MKEPPVTPMVYRRLEAALDDFDDEVRANALTELCALLEQRGEKWPPVKRLVNMHGIHRGQRFQRGDVAAAVHDNIGIPPLVVTGPPKFRCPLCNA